ncbi:MAG TPA: APC family permease, partial [Candidatus Sulfotelmatobacter sp.]|nr:APC family permease [Candidatus Sulfotelmatobacter sp.]
MAVNRAMNVYEPPPPQEEFVPRLAKVVGVAAILASAVSQEYGSGINFVLTSSLGAYPAVTYLVPAAMIAAGLLLLPKVALFMRFSRVMPRAGSTYVWLTRSLSVPVGFVVAFLWFVGIVAGIGFLSFSFASFLASSLEALGLSGAWALTHAGHLVVGLALIWLVFGLHYSGVRNYGAFVLAILTIVVAAAAITVGYGFATPQATVLGAVQHVLGRLPQPPLQQTPSLGAMISVITLFMFAYGGLTAATSLGGEARDATRTMPRGIFLGWLSALILYGAVSLALFHAVPWWVVKPLVDSKHAELATTPGLIALVAPHAVAVLINVLVMLIVGKTVAPQMLDSSRYLYAWAQDRLLPRAFLHTAKSKAPDVALAITAVLGSLFLLEATFFGWAIGVTLRAMSLVLVFGMLGVGVFNLRFNRRLQGLTWAEAVTRGAGILWAG